MFAEHAFAAAGCVHKNQIKQLRGCAQRFRIQIADGVVWEPIPRQVFVENRYPFPDHFVAEESAAPLKEIGDQDAFTSWCCTKVKYKRFLGHRQPPQDGCQQLTTRFLRVIGAGMPPRIEKKSRPFRKNPAVRVPGNFR